MACCFLQRRLTIHMASVELWKSDGTESGTVRVATLYTDNAPVLMTQLTNVDGTLFFEASDDTHGRELWRSDGTPDGTVMVKDICPGGLGSKPEWLTNVGGTLFFVGGVDGTNGVELWKSDGTAEGTVMVKDIWHGSNESGPRELTNVDGTLYFSASGRSRVAVNSGEATARLTAR